MGCRHTGCGGVRRCGRRDVRIWERRTRHPSQGSADTSRRYNKADHPIAFHKGDMFAMAKKKIADIGPAPDNDEVFEVGWVSGRGSCAPAPAPAPFLALFGCCLLSLDLALLLFLTLALRLHTWLRLHLRLRSRSSFRCTLHSVRSQQVV